ncbi:hypothetical protein FNJ87_03785 [Nonlabens mediterrranea]|uniref:Uncharacterized protein n=1 Tax=Nonlabens mediterrranea TaxID=1419947 RepID=A0ABS0A2D4_9FLAO|nr:hypothetical protein [Nonlabens mediterrranea]
MRFLLLILLLVSNLNYAQDNDPAYVDFLEIDDTEFKDSPSFYVVDLKMTASDPGMALASWDAHKSLTKFLVELYDPTTNKLFHRKVYRDKSISIPASAKLVVSPIHLNLKGKSKTTTLSQSNYQHKREQRKNMEKLLKEMQEQDYQNNQSSKEIPWRWILRGIGLLALVVGLIAKFAGNKAEFKDYDRRNRKP